MPSIFFGFRSSSLLGFLFITVLVSSPLHSQDKPKGKLSASGREAVNASETKAKFEELLASRDLSQFRGYQSEAIGEGWKIEGKLLVFDGTGSGDLITKETYEDFELQYDWSISEGGNSGVMYHVTLGDDQPYLSGPELQILDDEKHPDGKSELTSAGAFYALYAPTEKKLRKVGTWNNCRLIVEGSKVTHYLNGKQVLEVDTGSEDFKNRVAASKFKDWAKFNQSPVGHIAFQNHGNAVKFRNIRIKRLSEADSATSESSESDSSQSLQRPAKNLSFQRSDGSGAPAAPPTAGVDK